MAVPSAVEYITVTASVGWAWLRRTVNTAEAPSPSWTAAGSSTRICTSPSSSVTVATPTESPRLALTALDTTSRNVSTSSATSSSTSATSTVACRWPAAMTTSPSDTAM